MSIAYCYLDFIRGVIASQPCTSTFNRNITNSGEKRKCSTFLFYFFSFFVLDVLLLLQFGERNAELETRWFLCVFKFLNIFINVRFYYFLNAIFFFRVVKIINCNFLFCTIYYSVQYVKCTDLLKTKYTDDFLYLIRNILHYSQAFKFYGNSFKPVKSERDYKRHSKRIFIFWHYVALDCSGWIKCGRRGIRTAIKVRLI